MSEKPILFTGAMVRAIDTYSRLWDSINAKRGYGWDKNPWVWTLSLMRLP